MSIIKNPEARGILVLILIIAVVAFVMMTTTGKLEQWFGITLFSGPRAFDKIVFVSDRTGTREIWIMNTDGSGQKQLTENARVVSAPAISPMGNRIAFVGSVGNAKQVFSVGTEGGARVQPGRQAAVVYREWKGIYGTARRRRPSSCIAGS
jgi:hypothetical protein